MYTDMEGVGQLEEVTDYLEFEPSQRSGGDLSQEMYEAMAGEQDDDVYEEPSECGVCVGVEVMCVVWGWRLCVCVGVEVVCVGGWRLCVCVGVEVVCVGGVEVVCVGGGGYVCGVGVEVMCVWGGGGCVCGGVEVMCVCGWRLCVWGGGCSSFVWYVCVEV